MLGGQGPGGPGSVLSAQLPGLAGTSPVAWVGFFGSCSLLAGVPGLAAEAVGVTGAIVGPGPNDGAAGGPMGPQRGLLGPRQFAAGSRHIATKS
jgi:hypothetical protein